MSAEATPVVIAPEGEIDLHSSVLVKEQIEPLIDARRAKVVVDLSGVSYIDSSGLAIFIEAMQRVQEYGGAFALCGLRESLQHIFAIARLDQVFRIFPDQAAALAG
jgi:anti-sigma B factor antagonist